MAWRIAGYYGIDHWLLPLLGTTLDRVPARHGAAKTLKPRHHSLSKPVMKITITNG